VESCLKNRITRGMPGQRTHQMLRPDAQRARRSSHRPHH
jgi:hypothetical protein